MTLLLHNKTNLCKCSLLRAILDTELLQNETNIKKQCGLFSTRHDNKASVYFETITQLYKQNVLDQLANFSIIFEKQPMKLISLT